MRAQAVTDQASQGDVLGRAGESLPVRRIDRGLTDLFEIGGMTESGQGVAVEDGHYVVLSDEEIAAAYPQSTQSIDIESFVSADEIPFVYLERPYYLAPDGKGAKVYALLRETLL